MDTKYLLISKQSIEKLQISWQDFSNKIYRFVRRTIIK